jgi:hypothetical protein
MPTTRPANHPEAPIRCCGASATRSGATTNQPRMASARYWRAATRSPSGRAHRTGWRRSASSRPPVAGHRGPASTAPDTSDHDRCRPRTSVEPGPDPVAAPTQHRALPRLHVDGGRQPGPNTRDHSYPRKRPPHDRFTIVRTVVSRRHLRPRYRRAQAARANRTHQGRGTASHRADERVSPPTSTGLTAVNERARRHTARRASASAPRPFAFARPGRRRPEARCNMGP